MSSPYFLPTPYSGQRGTFGVLPTRQPLAPRLEVFLSHASADKEHVALVRRQIEALGIDVYLAEHDPKPGTVLSEKVREAIHRSKAVVVLITTHSINSAFVQQEVGIAHDCGKPLVPIIEKGIDTRQLGILQGMEYLEFDPAQPMETMARITESLQPLVVKQLSGGPDAGTVLVLVGLGLIIGLIVFAAASSQGGPS